MCSYTSLDTYHELLRHDDDVASARSMYAVSLVAPLHVQPHLNFHSRISHLSNCMRFYSSCLHLNQNFSFPKVRKISFQTNVGHTRDIQFPWSKKKMFSHAGSAQPAGIRNMGMYVCLFQMYRFIADLS